MSAAVRSTAVKCQSETLSVASAVLHQFMFNLRFDTVARLERVWSWRLEAMRMPKGRAGH
eukprot:scaffold27213_cov118-Isochrysis_galbana.AAC.1